MILDASTIGSLKMEKGGKERSLWIHMEREVVCAQLQSTADSSEIRKYKEISDFLFFLTSQSVQHNQAILSLDAACHSPCTGQSLVMGSLDKEIFL